MGEEEFTSATDTFAVFVYGTLLPGFGNYRLISTFCLGSEPAKLFGAGVWEGPGFPYMRTSKSEPMVSVEDAVQGALLFFNEADRREVLCRLDRLEGYSEVSRDNHYNRIEVEVIRDSDKRRIPAFVYEASDGIVRASTRRILTKTLPDGGVLGDWAATRR